MDELEYLLNLDGEIFPMDNGYWVKFEAKKVQKTNLRPHGISHKKMSIVAYEFESPSQLIEDFWISVEQYMEDN